MPVALNDSDFNWREAEWFAALLDFGVLEEIRIVSFISQDNR